MRRIRLGLEMTQERLAERAELHPNYISSVERGERNISIRNIERIAKALRVTMAELVSDSGETTESEFATKGLYIREAPAEERALEPSKPLAPESAPTEGKVP